MVGPKANRIVRESEKYRVKSAFSYPFVIKDGKGCYLEDVDNKKYIDFNSFVCTNNIGYGNPEIKEVIREYSKLGTYKMDGTGFYCEEALDLSKKLLKLVPKNLKKVFLINSGAEAVENAIKMAYLKSGPRAGISCKGAFHGRTLGALSYTESKSVQKESFPEVPNHVIEFCTSDTDSEIGELEDLLKRESKPAFVIVETVQGEGGYRPASKLFMKTLRRVTQEHGIPLIIDEIQAGMGRTGKWWAFQHYGVEPDIMTSAKSLQVGAAITSSKYDVSTAGAVGSTWGGGHRLDLALGLKVIEIIERDKLVKNAETMGKYFMKRLGEFKTKYKVIGEVRGLGLMIGIELNSKKNQKTILQSAFKNGLLLLGCGEKSIRIAPPLVINKEIADKGLEKLELGLGKLQ